MKATSSALFSICRKYRYVLWRRWDFTKPDLMVIGLNPSTADESADDPTIRRCRRFATNWGFGGLCMTNLFALRATYPKIMKRDIAPIGAENDKWLKTSAENAGMILAAWGNDGGYYGRDKHVINLLRPVKDIKCLGITKQKQPRHPLYVKADTKPFLYIAGE